MLTLMHSRVLTIVSQSVRNRGWNIILGRIYLLTSIAPQKRFFQNIVWKSDYLDRLNGLKSSKITTLLSIRSRAT